MQLANPKYKSSFYVWLFLMLNRYCKSLLLQIKRDCFSFMIDFSQLIWRFDCSVQIFPISGYPINYWQHRYCSYWIWRSDQRIAACPCWNALFNVGECFEIFPDNIMLRFFFCIQFINISEIIFKGLNGFCWFVAFVTFLVV